MEQVIEGRSDEETLRMLNEFYSPPKIGGMSEEEVVNMVNRWRISESDGEKSEEELGFNKLEEAASSKPLKRDNVAMDEVVDIIKEFRANKALRKYTPYKVATKEPIKCQC
ncbi:unnamed protein product [Rhizophagus irregularis]|uniref:Uncharacterized protein n=1 Tax=Rhizophagus irregularis TaxID=588596 RepID=A0A2I1HDX7_9GLOM|nr:hypothetical protein RhiirA4_477907 [Rhizophagus irregularis]CAB4404407.1 unnamed protein product [Rhizophagus irregularis]